MPRGGKRPGAGRKPKPQPTFQPESPKVGAPSKFREEYAGQALKLCELGATDRDLAEFFGVSIVTVWRWGSEHRSFSNALKVGKGSTDDRVERSLFQRAVGYSHDAVKIFANNRTGENAIVPYVEHYPPDTTAAIFWLKNRRRGEWRDKVDHEHTGADGQPLPAVQTVIILPSNGRSDNGGEG